MRTSAARSPSSSAKRRCSRASVRIPQLRESVMTVPAPAHIRAIAPYQPGKPISELAREMGLDEANIIKLASNENPLGVSPLAQRAIEEAVQDVARYPDGNGFA